MPEHRSSGADDGRGCRAYRQGQPCGVCDGLLSQGFANTKAKSPRDRAVTIIEDSRRTHVEWRDYLLAYPDHPTRTEHGDVGDLAHHETCIADYDLVLEVLRGDTPLCVWCRAGVMAPPGPTDCQGCKVAPLRSEWPSPRSAEVPDA